MADDKVALIDMDGTLADYDGGMRESLAKLLPPADATTMRANKDLDLHSLEDDFPYMKARMDLIKQTPGWWQQLPVLAIGMDVLLMCRDIGFDIHILTKGPKKTPSGWTEKLLWFNQHVIPKAPKAGITVTTTKGLTYGRVLVDDYPPYIKSWLDHRPRGLVIMPDQPWNRNFNHPQVIRIEDPFINSSLVRSELQKAFDR